MGDVNGDGFADLIVTATVCDGLLPGGGAYLLYGGPERLEGALPIGDVATHLTLPVERVGQEGCGTTSNAPLGLGDIDGDGLGDFMLIHYRSPDYEDPAATTWPRPANGCSLRRAIETATGTPTCSPSSTRTLRLCIPM